MESWRAITGYEGRYEVSSLGGVRSVDRVSTKVSRWGTDMVQHLKGKSIATHPWPNKYIGVQLGRGKGNAKLVHRLVAEAFVEGDTSLQVNHRNGKRDDNRVENLEWLSCAENHKHSYRELSRKQHVWTTPVTLVKDGVSMFYASVLSAANSIGVVPGSISSAYRRGHLCRGFGVVYGAR